MNSRMTKLKVAVVVLVIILVISVGFLILSLWEKQNGQYIGEGQTLDDNIRYNGIEYALKDNIETFLIIGLDKYEGESSADSYNNDKQADFLLLLVFDNEQKKSTAIQINRDTMVDINVLGVAGERVGTVTKQITLAHTYGNGRDVSCRNTADAVSTLLKGVNINHYVSMTMESVSILNDLVGGVELTVLDDFSDVDHSLVQGENVILNGEQALIYVRTRSGLDDSTNMARMKRQKQYLNALYERVGDRIYSDKDFVVNASLKLSDYIISDRSVTQLQELMKKYREFELVEICELNGETVLGEEYVEFYPAEDSLMKLVIDNFYKVKN